MLDLCYTVDVGRQGKLRLCRNTDADRCTWDRTNSWRTLFSTMRDISYPHTHVLGLSIEERLGIVYVHKEDSFKAKESSRFSRQMMCFVHNRQRISAAGGHWNCANQTVVVEDVLHLQTISKNTRGKNCKLNRNSFFFFKEVLSQNPLISYTSRWLYIQITCNGISRRVGVNLRI